jgi:lysyl-tRNA synthetase class 2
MLEWYAPDTSLTALIEEFIDLLAGLTDAPDEWREGLAVEHHDYGELMQSFAGINPHQTTERALEAHLDAYDVEISHLAGPRDEQWRSDALDFIFSTQVQSHLEGLCTVSGFPGSQAALAEIEPTTGLAQRTELYASGIELMNAYQELRDPDELDTRWKKASEARSRRGMSKMALDVGLRDAMALMPVCAGAAVGFDRLLMCMLGLDRLDEVMILPWQDG